jgi:Tfp pilus assembly protein PilP
MGRLVTILLACALLLAAGCGQSSEDKAKKQVCNARADIQKQVNELKNLTLATATTSGIKNNLTAIENGLKQIKDAQGDLNSERKSQVKQATQEFESQLTSIVQSVGSSTSLSAAATQLQSAVKQLASSFEQSLAKVNCS